MTRRLTTLILLTLAIGCSDSTVFDTPGMAVFRRLLSASEAAVALVDSVRDAESAREAVPQLPMVFEELREATIEAARYEAENGEIRGFAPVINKMNSDAKANTTRMQLQIARINNLKDLPEEFWETFQLEAVGMTLALMEANIIQLDDAQRQFAYQIRNMYQDLGHSQVIELIVSNMPRRLAERVEQHLRDAIGTKDLVIYAADGEEPRTWVYLLGPVPDFEAATEVVAELGMVTFSDLPRRKIELKLDKRNFESVPKQPVDSVQDATAAIAEEIEMQAELFEEAQAARFPRPEDEDYHSRLADLLIDEGAVHHEKAVRKLARLPPSDVQDREVRVKIARGFRDLVASTYASGMGSTPFVEDEAIRGLSNWAGKHATPTLVDILINSRLQVPSAVFTALGANPDPRGADAVVNLLGNFFNHQAAVTCLRRMGTVAEDALIRVAPSDEPEVSLAAVRLLSECGTQKSLPLLKQAMRSSNPQVRSAAKLTRQSILARTRPEEE